METRLIIANFPSDKLDDVERRLQDIGVERINVLKVKGFGEYHDTCGRTWLTDEVRVEIFTRKDEVSAVTAAIMQAAHTGVPGDGVVAVLPIEALYLIRTRAEATPESFWPRASASGIPADQGTA